MPRLPLITDEDAPKELLEDIAASGADWALVRLHAHAKDSYRGYAAFNGSLYKKQQLEPFLREAAITYTCMLSDAEYEWSPHVKWWKFLGARDEQVQALLRRDLNPALFDEKVRTVLQFTQHVVLDVRAPDGVLDALKRLLSTREIIELLQSIGVYMMNSRLAVNAGISSNDDRFPTKNPD